MNKAEWIKIAKGAVIAASGAVLAYATTVLIPSMQASGDVVLLTIAAAASVAINIARKRVDAYTNPPTNE